MADDKIDPVTNTITNTVHVKSADPKGMIINQSTYDANPKKYELWHEPRPEPKPEPQPQSQQPESKVHASGAPTKGKGE